MHVHILQADLGGSGFYRVTEVARAANESDLDVKVTYGTEADIEGTAYAGKVEVTTLHLQADVLVVQRAVSQQMHATIVAAKRQGIPVVVDLDDDFHNIHAGNAALRALSGPWENKRWLLESCQLADLVTVSTPGLRKYARPGRARVVRNYLPARATALRVHPTGPSPRYGLGWTGTLETHPNDLQRTGGALARLDAPIVVVGDVRGVAQALNVPPDAVYPVPWVDSVEGYWQAIVDHIGVGFVPLEQSTFNKGKSWLKGMEFAALGVPFVASPLPEYVELCRAGVGEVAASVGQWTHKLRRLLQDEDYYQSQRWVGIEYHQYHTLESHVADWVGAWRDAAAF